jgi:hypothetical protein
MMRLIASLTIFVIALVLMLLACTAAWDACVNDRIYNCTDGGTLDFLFPGHWVHNPVVVHQIVGGRSISEPDQIKEGWSPVKLWCLWVSFMVAAVGASGCLAFVPWLGRRRHDEAG